MLWTMIFETPPPRPTAGPDESLLFRLAEGDQTAMTELYTATSSAVYGFALSIVKNTADAEDIMQETYIRIYRAAPTYQRLGKPMAWILTIVRNLSLMKLRERKTDTLPDDFELSSGETLHLVSENRLVLRTALRHLSDEERQIVTLYAISGMKHREISELLGLTLSTTLSKYHRALKKLQILLKEGDV